MFDDRKIDITSAIVSGFSADLRQTVDITPAQVRSTQVSSSGEDESLENHEKVATAKRIVKTSPKMEMEPTAETAAETPTETAPAAVTNTNENFNNQEEKDNSDASSATTVEVKRKRLCILYMFMLLSLFLEDQASSAVKSDSGPVKDKQALICDEDEDVVHSNGVPNGTSPSKFEILEPEGTRRKSTASQESSLINILDRGISISP